MNPPQMTIAAQDGGDWRTLNASGQLLKRAAFPADAKVLRFTVDPPVGGPGAYYQSISTGFEAGTPTTEIHDGMEIYREYQNAHGGVIGSAGMGEPVTEVLRMRSLNGRDITNVSIVDLLPGGFEIANSSIQPGLHSAGCDYVDVREDRVLFYTTVTPEARAIIYQIKGTNRGEFTTPPIFAESMYDRGIKARGIPGSLRVTDHE